jgi:hypothetical protein
MPIDLILRCTQIPTRTKMKSTTYDKFKIIGSHRNKQSYVDDLNGNLLFVIDKEDGSFFNQTTTSYFVGSRSEKYKSFMSDSWSQLASQLSQIIS